MSKSRIEGLIQLLTDPENQPHQYYNNPDGLRQALLEASPIYCIICHNTFSRDTVTYVDLSKITAITKPAFDQQGICINIYTQEVNVPIVVHSGRVFPCSAPDLHLSRMKETVFTPLLEVWDKWNLRKD